MKQICIRADSFVVKKRRMLVYRLRQPGNATLLWTSRDAALRHLTNLQHQRLQAKDKGR